MFVIGNAEPQTKLRIVFKQGVRPGGAAPVGVLAPGRGGQVAAVDGGTTGGVGYQHAIAKQLTQQLQVRRFTAPSAGSREFKQGLLQLLFANLVQFQLAAIAIGQALEKVPIAAFALPQRRLRFHVDRFAQRHGLVTGRTDINANRAAGAIFRRDLDSKFLPGKVLVAAIGGQEALRRSFQLAGIVDFATNHRVGANHDALAALDADIGIPDGDELGDIAFFPLGGGARIGAVAGQGADGQIVPFLDQHLAFHLAHELGSRSGNRRQATDGTVGLANIDLKQVLQGAVHCVQVHLNDLLPLLAVGLDDRLFDLRDRLFPRQHPRQGKEASLHHRVDASAHAVVAGYLVGIDGVDL